MRILAIDFDGVIHDRAHPVNGRRMGPPYEDSKQSMEFLKSQGNTLMVHTVMAVTESGKKAVIDWLNYYQIPFDEVTAIKPNADRFIDDKALKHIDWATTLAELDK